MPDITMCSNNNCPLKHNCYRFMANPSQWQSYAEFKFCQIHHNTYACDDFWCMKVD